MKTIFFIWDSVESQKSNQVLINDLFYYGYDIKIVSLFIKEKFIIKEFAEDENCLIVFTEKNIDAKNRKLRWLPREINAVDIMKEINQECVVLN